MNEKIVNLMLVWLFFDVAVDLRSSKVCGIGLLNIKAQHVFYPFERDKFRCRYDYYWASVFKVASLILSSLWICLQQFLTVYIISQTMFHFPNHICLLLISKRHILISSRFRWSQSQVEYKDHLMGQTRLAFSEAPNEALPPECRPNFGAALLTKDNFKAGSLTIL